MRKKRISAYAGVDPTAPSLHLGHLLAFMPLFWMYLHGYGAFTLIGTTTAKVGDPTGRTTSRPKLAKAELLQNMVAINEQLKTLWSNVEQNGTRFGYEREWAWRRAIINNTTWWNKQTMVEVLQRLGNHMRIGPMLGRDNVKARLDDGSGMSFSEFCYPLMQAWDWCELWKQRGTQMQIGGSDQYGNILTGAQCVKAYVQNEPDPQVKHPSGPMDQPVGFTVPLLTDSSGAKFGKSAGNAVWLDPFKTSPFDLYGYLVRRADDEVEKLLKLFTFFPQSKIMEVMQEHIQDPPKRVAQHLLALEVTQLVHGKATAVRTQQEHRDLYDRRTVTLESIRSGAQEIEHYTAPHGETLNASNRPRVDMKLPESLLDGSLARLAWAAGLASSASDANRLIKAGGLYLGGSPGQHGLAQTGMRPDQISFSPVRAWSREANMKYLIEGKIMLLRKGKHNLRFVEFISDEEFNRLGLTYHGQPNTGLFRKAMTALQKATDQVKQSQEGGNAEAKLDESELDVPEAVKRSDRYRTKMAQLKSEGLVKDNGW